jgi:ribosomal protein S18 acetylase RimI-like enzyme
MNHKHLKLILTALAVFILGIAQAAGNDKAGASAASLGLVDGFSYICVGYLPSNVMIVVEQTAKVQGGFSSVNMLKRHSEYQGGVELGEMLVAASGTNATTSCNKVKAVLLEAKILGLQHWHFKK